MILETPTRKISFPRRPLLMGIVNINDDSFSGDGTLDPKKALEQARKQIQGGADIIDIGAESARTNREAISVEEEVRRLRSFLDGWARIRDETKAATTNKSHLLFFRSIHGDPKSSNKSLDPKSIYSTICRLSQMTEMRDFAQNTRSPFLLCIPWVSPRYPTLTNVGVTSWYR